MVIARRFARVLLLALTLTIALVSPTAAQRDPSNRDDFSDLAAAPSRYCIATHDVGKLTVGITNFGMVGLGTGKGSAVDCFTGYRSSRGEYPKGSNTVYLYEGALWVGGVVGRDTLVSCGADFNVSSREMHPTASMIKRTSVDPYSPYYDKNAVSEQDYIAVYTDTFLRAGYGSWDPIDNRGHKPLGIEVTQSSYAWSYGHTDDFIIWTYRIRNIGRQAIRSAYFGLYWDPDVHKAGSNLLYTPPEVGKGTTEGRDDLSGFIYDTHSPFEVCEDFRDTIGLAWAADQDGDFKGGEFEVPDVAGIRVLGPAMTDPQLDLSYNWWVYNYNPFYDFGPQARETYREMGNGTGTPYGDRNKYHLLSNAELDYDQARTLEIGSFDMKWVQPNIRQALSVARGADVQQLLSIGPYELQPGAVIDFPVVWAAGKGFHSIAANYQDNIRRNYDVDAYYANLDFSQLIRNAITANRVYDIPGVDSDNDGYAGKYRICVLDSEFVDDHWIPAVAETTYYEGDGAPDFKAAAPPPSPQVWLIPVLDGIKIRFNGMRSETVSDVFSDLKDFEGYRVYFGRDNREESFQLVAQYDRLNYDKYVYTVRGNLPPEYIRLDNPYSIDSLRCLYGTGPDPCADSSFDPLRYTPAHPYLMAGFSDSIFYFDRHDYNQSEFGINTPIEKIYPDQEPPSSLLNPRPDELTEDGYLKYYEYEMTLDNLLPSVPYYIAVTAFDFGSPKAGLAPLESSKTLIAKTAYPDNQWDRKPDSLTNIYVYPNPYRQDDWYRIAGFEGRGQEDRSRDRVRKVTFANLPARCTISIFTLDGDLVRRIEHDIDPSDPNSPYEEWDLVTRNIQLVVSGLYYWVVETPDGKSQIGKLVILL